MTSCTCSARSLAARLRSRSHDDPRNREGAEVRPKLRQWMVIAAATLVAACESPRIGGPRGNAGGTGGTGTAGGPTAAGLVGTWRRILYFIAGDGSTGSN